MNNTAVRVDYFSAIERQRAKVAKLGARVEALHAEFDGAVQELNRLEAAASQAVR
jgi:hypothetical protein